MRLQLRSKIGVAVSGSDPSLGYLLLGLLVLWASLLPMKAAERFFSHQPPNTGPAIDWPAAWASGIPGRLDDPSFWTVFAAILSGGMVYAVQRMLIQEKVRLAVSVVELRWSETFFLIMSIGYLASVLAKGETFFYWLCSPRLVPYVQYIFPWIKPKPQGYPIIAIQVIEGLIVLYAIFTGCVVFHSGLRNVRSVSRACKNASRKKQPIASWLKHAATAIASAGIAPFSFLFIAPFVFSIWSYLLRGGEPLWTLPWPAFTILLTIALFGSPFIFVSIFAIRSTRHICHMDLASMQIHQFAVWIALSITGHFPIYAPPRWLLFPAEITDPVARLSMEAMGFITAFFPVAFWAVGR